MVSTYVQQFDRKFDMNEIFFYNLPLHRVKAAIISWMENSKKVGKETFGLTMFFPLDHCALFFRESNHQWLHSMVEYNATFLILRNRLLPPKFLTNVKIPFTENGFYLQAKLPISKNEIQRRSVYACLRNAD